VEKIREVVERLVKHEDEAVQVRAEAAGAEIRSEALIQGLDSRLCPFFLQGSFIIDKGWQR
jgi:hypothetical protein